MVRRPVLKFLVFVSILILASILFIQSTQFAKIIKKVGSRYIPRDLVEADFSELSVRFFPPGLSIRNPSVRVGKEGYRDLLPGTSIKAKSLDLFFRPLQVLSGTIRIHQVVVSDGSVQVLIRQEKKKQKEKFSIQEFFSWDELLNVRAESISIHNSEVRIQIHDASSFKDLTAFAQDLRLSQWSGKGGLGYSALIDFKKIDGSLARDLNLGIPLPLESLYADVRVNSLGVEIQSISAAVEGVSVAAKGQLNGNLLESKTMGLDLNLNAQGYLDSLRPWVKGFPKDIKGHTAFMGTVSGKVGKGQLEIDLEGTLNAKDFSFQGWHAENIQAKGSWNSVSGRLKVGSARIESEIRETKWDGVPADGGVIKVGSFDFQPNSNEPLTLPLDLKDAHIHWLGAGVIGDVYPLGLRINGQVDVTIGNMRKSPRDIRIKLDTSVRDFELNNQRYKKEKELARIFKIPEIGLKGQFKIDDVGFHPQDVHVTLPRSHLILNGKIDFESGYDLFAEGPINLQDLGQIAENDVFGEGSFLGRFEGPPSRVIMGFDVNLKNSKYLNLNLGSLNGRIGWDDGPGHLTFTGIQLNQGLTRYRVDGLVAPSEDEVNLDVRFSRGNIQDLVYVFDFLTSDLNWFPHELNGPFTGIMKVSGGIGLDKLSVLSQLNGSNWEAWGERWKAVYVSGGFFQGKYRVDSFNGLKRSGRVEARVSVSRDGFLDWNVETKDFGLKDLNFLARLDVPMRGDFAVQSSGQGVFGKINSKSFLSVDRFSVRGKSYAPLRAELETDQGVSKFNGKILGGQAELDILYDFNAKAENKIVGSLHEFDFSPILLLLNPSHLRDSSLRGLISGDMELKFNTGKSEKANGYFQLTDYILQNSEARFSLSGPDRIKIEDGSFDLKKIGLVGDHGKLSLDLEGKNGKIRGNLSGDLDVSLLQFLVPGVTRSSGVAKTSLDIQGSLDEPRVQGTLDVSQGSLRMASLDSNFENIRGGIEIDQGKLKFKDVRSDLGGGLATVSGDITLNTQTLPQLNLKANLKNSKLKIYPFQVAKISGDIGLSGDGHPYLVSGKVQIESAISREKVLNRTRTAQGLKAAQYAPPPRQQVDSGLARIKLDLLAVSDGEIFVQNDLFKDVEMQCKLKIVNTLEAPRILGKVDVLSGKLLFKDHEFEIRSAVASFDNPTVLNPLLDLNALTEINQVKIQLFATGRQDNLKVELTSNPAMAESEILSLLAVGLTTDDARRLNSSDLSVVQQGEAASLVLHSLDFNRELENKTGFQINLDESINPQQGVSAFSPQGDNVAAPQITIRRKLGERLSLSAGSTVGVGTNRANQVNLDFLVNPNLSIRGVFNNYGNFSTSDSQTFQNSGGVDLNFQKRFK